ncbi:hypothetical protein [Methylobacter tundripaludum]|uniref:hypothetical protein n=1 Tax=Methylobacter tundripaludum TaxID=173365 RepID=UPI0015E32215|nr:hypothetical protein [Methylobacter tundripaludum]
MKTIINYLDDLKEKYGSDYKTAKLLKTGTGAISTIRSRSQCGDETAIKIADLLGIDRTEVLIAAAIARSEGEVKKSWETISKMSGIAASVALVGVLTLGNSSIGADLELIHSTTKSVYYVKLYRRLYTPSLDIG